MEYEKLISVSEKDCQKSDVDLEMLHHQKDLLFSQLMGDENRYMQIMLNFLSNSLKFTKKKGKIKIVIDLQEIQ